jgi:hypothetical protein
MFKSRLGCHHVRTLALGAIMARAAFNSLEVDCLDELSRVPTFKQRRQRWLAATGSLSRAECPDARAKSSPAGSSIAAVIVLHGRIIAGLAISH